MSRQDLTRRLAKVEAAHAPPSGRFAYRRPFHQIIADSDAEANIETRWRSWRRQGPPASVVHVIFAQTDEAAAARSAAVGGRVPARMLMGEQQAAPDLGYERAQKRAINAPKRMPFISPSAASSPHSIVSKDRNAVSGCSP